MILYIVQYHYANTNHHADRPHILTVSNLFTAAECERWIAQGEGLGFEAASVSLAAGAKMMPEVRNNDRAVFEDADCAAVLWERVRGFVPSQLDGCLARGLSERFRFYRYDPGQRFKRHRDGAVDGPLGLRSKLTFLIYLNDGYEGGETAFIDYRFVNGVAVPQEIKIAGKTGMGLFFRHERKHEGSPVLSGRKYVLRTDVLYDIDPDTLPSLACLQASRERSPELPL